MSELARFIDYDEEGDPVLVIHKKQLQQLAYASDRDARDAFRVPLNDAWQFSEDHYPAPVPCLLGFDRHGMPVMERRYLSFERFMFLKTRELCEVLGLGEPTTRRMADIAATIEAGLEDLIKTKPRPTEATCIGEVKISIGKDGDSQKVMHNDIVINVPISTMN
jgi:hypothetical protein